VVNGKKYINKAEAFEVNVLFRSKNEIDMCNGSITPKLLMYAIPIMLSGYLQLLFNAADMAVVGQFGTNGEKSLAAVGATSSLVNLIVNIFMGMSVGANAVVGRRIGAGDKTGVKNAVHTSVFIGIFSGFVVMIIGLLLCEPMLGFMKTPEDISGLSALYLRIYFIGAPFLMFYNFGSAILRAIGDTRRPLYFLTISGVTNVILNVVFVFFFKLDVAGVAIATVISQIVSAVLVFVTLVRHTGIIRLFPKEIRPSAVEVKQIMQIGIPAGIQGSMFSVSNMIVQSSINAFGTETVAACSAASSIEGFVYTGMNSFYQTVLSFVSQNFGRRNFKRINQIIRRSVLLVIMTGLLIGCIVMSFNEFLIGLYLPQESENRALMLDLALQRNMVVVWPYFICGIMEIFVGSLRAMGQSLIPMISTIVGVCGGRMFWIFVIFERFNNDSTVFNLFGCFELTKLQVLMLAWPFAWIIATTAHFITLMLELHKHKRKDMAISRITVINSNSKTV